jgi:tRNA-dihydrouridine synthase B
MVGVTDIAFRILCRRHGASLASIEMTAANAILHSEKVAKDILQFSDEDRPLTLQLMGTNAAEIVKAAKRYEEKIDILDINMGCPSKTVTRIGAGSALLTTPNKIKEIVKACTSSLSIPVTVKMRAGYDVGSINVVEIAKMCEENGIAAVGVHGRTKSQGYRGLADWGIIKEVKDNISIPVIGNGDVKRPEDAFKMLEKTGCDYVMIARAAMTDPTIFEKIIELRKEGRYDKITKKEKLGLVHEYIGLAQQYNVPFPRIKTNTHNLTAGIAGSKRFRLAINSMQGTKEVLAELEKLAKDI